MNAELPGKIETLSDWQLALLTAAQAERMFPNFELFAGVTDSFDASVMRLALDKVWDQLSQRGNCNAEVQLERVEEQTPDVDEYDIYGVYPALDAAVAIAASLEQLIQPSADDALNINLLAEEAIASYLEMIAEPDLSDEELVRYINTHELMLQHQAFLENLIAQLAAIKTPKASIIDELRKLAHNQGVSNIGICVED